MFDKENSEKLGVPEDKPITAYKVLIRNVIPKPLPSDHYGHWNYIGGCKYYSPNQLTGWVGSRKSAKPTWRRTGMSERGIYCYASARAARDEWIGGNYTKYNDVHPYVVVRVHLWGTVYRCTYRKVDWRLPAWERGRPKKRLGYLAQHCEIIEELEAR